MPWALQMWIWTWRNGTGGDREQMIFQVEKARAQERGPSRGEMSLTRAQGVHSKKKREHGM